MEKRRSQRPLVDLAHMDYDWIEANLHSPRSEGDSALYAPILVGQTASSDDSGLGGALTLAMLLWGEFQPNDSVQSALDSVFHTFTPRSRLLGRGPTLSDHHVVHFDLDEHRPAWANAMSFLTQRRRVTVTLTRARLLDLEEPDHPFWDWRPAEVVFESGVRSPLAAALWSIDGSLSTRGREGATAPLYQVTEAGLTLHPMQVVFDDFVLDDETHLFIDFGAREIDWDVRYGVFEALGDGDDQSLGAVTVEVPLISGVRAFSAGGVEGDLTVEVFDYPFPRLGVPGDLDGDGAVAMSDLLALLKLWTRP